MKHLKLFEGYLDDYYSLMNGSEWSSDVKKIVSMEQKYIDKLTKLDFQLGERRGFYWAHKEIPNVTLTEDLFIDIYQIEDDYFIVRTNLIYNVNSGYPINKFSYFKCDQFDGLLKFIKDGNL